nr:MAG TPA: hypothetical protein [Caudoviricetes sp.]
MVKPRAIIPKTNSSQYFKINSIKILHPPFSKIPASSIIFQKESVIFIQFWP